MQRINLTPKTEFTLPIKYDGKDYDLVVNTEAFNYDITINKMAENLKTLGETYKNEADLNKVSEKQGEIFKQMSDDFYTICPKLAEITKKQPITILSVWLMIFDTISKETQNIRSMNEALKDIAQEQKTSV